jgi:hypothetical protein
MLRSVKVFFFSSYQKRLGDEILDLVSSADQARDNKSQAKTEVKAEKFSLTSCRER